MKALCWSIVLFLAVLVPYAAWGDASKVGGRSATTLTQTPAQNFWERTSSPDPTGTVGIEALAITKNSEIFAASNTGSCFDLNALGIFRSTDNGDVWTPANSGLASTNVRSLAVSPSGDLFAGTHNGVFRSANNGGSWAPTGLTSVDVSALLATSSALYAADGCFCTGVYRSTNNGASWIRINTGLATCVNGLAVNSGGHLFAATGTSGVFRSTNNGDSWQPVNAGLNILNARPIVVNASDHLFVGTVSGGLFRSTDNGESWTLANSGLPKVFVYTLAINPIGHIFAGMADGRGMFRSTDNGTTWEPVNTGLDLIGSITALAFNSAGVIFTTNSRSVFRSVQSTIPCGRVVTFDRQLITTETQPVDVAVGDLNGDGRSDMVVVIYSGGSGNTVSVFRNTSSSGAISFAASSDFTVGTGPEGVAIGDLDGDGKPDIVTANASSDTVSVLRNIGTGSAISFASTIELPGGHNPHRVMLGDIDTDGKPDIVATNNGGVIFSVFRNTSGGGAISFAPRIDIPVITFPNTLALEDIDGDARLDVILPQATNVVLVFRNVSASGTISFAPAVPFSTAIEPQGVTSGDLDGDGRSDLIVATSVSNSVSVFRNTSTGGAISFDPRADFGTGNPVHGVAIGDIDGDGKRDVIVTSVPNAVSVFRNTSGGSTISFAARIDFATGAAPVDVAVGDLDGDGKPDMAVSNHQGSSISVYRNTSGVVGCDADLAITKTASPSPVLTGSNITYTITVTNNGPSEASNVSVTDNLSADTTFVSCASTEGGICEGSGNDRRVSFSSLPAGASATITIVASLNCSVADATVIDNAVIVDSSTPDSSPTNNSGTVTVTASNPPPSITCPGNIAVTEMPRGSGSAPVNYAPPSVNDNCSDVTMTCAPAPGQAFPLGTTTVTCTASDAGGRTASCSFTVTVTGPSLHGTIGIWDGSLWPLDGPAVQKIQVTAKSQTTGIRFDPVQATDAKYRFDNLPDDTYDLSVDVDYLQAVSVNNFVDCRFRSSVSGGCAGLPLPKVTTVKARDVQVSRTTKQDIKLPMPLVMVHGTFACYQKWYAPRGFPNAPNHWDNYATSQGFISVTPNYSFIADNSGHWEDAAFEIANQVELFFRELSNRIRESSAFPAWVYIGHSQGGLIARVLTSGLRKETPLVQSLRQAFLLGTPNSGVFDVGALLLCNPLLGRTQMMTSFNLNFPNFGRLGQQEVVAYAGTRDCFPPGSSNCDNRPDDNDSVVTVDSVFNIYQQACDPSGCSTPIAVFMIVDREELFYTHEELGSPRSRLEILTRRILPRVRVLTR